jgi:hypothetical protein
MAQITLEQFKSEELQRKTIKLRAIKDGKAFSRIPWFYKEGDIVEAKFFGSMVFFTKGGETIHFYDFELV